MRTTAIALSLGLGLGLCSLPSFAASLAEQFTLMEKGADSALDTRLFSHDGVDIKAWVDGTPVIIAVPILNEQGKQEGESRYYFKGGKLFGVIDLSNQLTMYYLVLVIFLAAMLLIYRIIHSPFGEVLV